MKNILPTLSSKNEIEDGTVIEALPYCKTNCHKAGCSKFYENIKKNAKSGFYVCPKGLTVYVSRDKELLTIYPSMRVKGFYKKGSDQYLQRAASTDVSFSPIISEDFFQRLLAIDEMYTTQEREIETVHNVYGEMLHDIRKICAHIKNKCEDIIALDENSKEIAEQRDIFDVLQKVKNIEALSGIAVSRFEAYDISMNPETICLGTKRNRVIYQKFHKAKYMLMGYLDKDVSIQLEGRSTFEFPVYQTFDVLPFILLENAVKYAPKESTIMIKFREEHGNLYVAVASEGPLVAPEEIPNLCNSGFRGRNAQITKIRGQGLGLGLVKDICDAHGVILNFASTSTRKIQGIPYGDFEVNLTFFRNQR